MLKKAILIMSLFVIVSMTGCSKQKTTEQSIESNLPSLSSEQAQKEKQIDSTVEIDSTEETDDTIVIHVTLDKLKNLDTTEELIENVEAIVIGKCISSEVFFQNNTMYTISQVKVEQNIKGDIQDSDLINIVEIGGKTTYKEYKEGCNIEKKSFITEEIEADNKIVLDFGGFRAMEEEEEVLLFLVDSSGFITDFDSKLYAVIGDFDGKLYKQTENLYSRPIDQNSKSKFTSANENLTIDIKNLKDLLD